MEMQTLFIVSVQINILFVNSDIYNQLRIKTGSSFWCSKKPLINYVRKK